MLKMEVETALNKQINAEIYSAYLYLSMAAWAHDKNLNGVANWMQVQAQEEMFHAMKIYGYVNDRGGRVNLTAIDGPPTDWESPLHLFEQVYKHEVHVTSLIHNLVDVAQKEKDRSTESMLQWFVDEQVEEESTADDIVQQIKLAGEQGAGLFMVDRELATRVYTPPAAEGAA
jgi:ferritin